MDTDRLDPQIARIQHADHATIRVVMNTKGQSKAMKNVAFLD